MKATSAIAAALAILAANAALANGPTPAVADPVVAVSAPDNFWEGFYAGATIGMGNANYDIEIDIENPMGPEFLFLNLPDLGGQGGVFGLNAGYSFALSSSLIAGIQLDAQMTSIVNDTLLEVDISGDDLSFLYELSPSQILTISGRIGVLTSPDTQIYGLLGYSQGTFEGSYDLYSNSFSIDEEGSYDFELTGMAFGAGIETRVTQSMSVAIEYRYIAFEDYSFIEIDEPDVVGNVGFGTDVQTVSAAVRFHF